MTRGMGLLLGMALDRQGKPFVEACFEKGFLINCTQDTILRFTPPLIVEEEEVESLIKALRELLRRGL
jgi:acetylornithine/N-succinyldiaminopimelate aminotransferase